MNATPRNIYALKSNRTWLAEDASPMNPILQSNDLEEIFHLCDRSNEGTNGYGGECRQQHANGSRHAKISAESKYPFFKLGQTAENVLRRDGERQDIIYVLTVVLYISSLGRQGRRRNISQFENFIDPVVSM